jgi:hypothetical protein
VGDIPKAKSTSTLAHPHVNFAVANDGKHHTRKGTAPLPLRIPFVRHHTASVDDEWWHRAGLAIAGETRDSKGQGWLVRRESSTSLVANEDQDQHDSKRMALLSGEHLNGEEFPTFSPRMSRAGSRFPSRVGSRVHSARQSRRGSRVGSRIDLGMSPVSARHSLDQDLPSFDERFMTGPDFVEDPESSGDEEEVARLAHSGGSWIDRLIGWTLFSVDEDREASSDEEDEGEENGAFLPSNMTREELRLRREVEAKRRKLEREAIIAAAKLKARDKENVHVDAEGGSRPSTAEGEKAAEEGGGWQDAAWLLSVASKALF